ncbi:pyridoxal phosphate-dependent transferase [Flagelloscypha sp. PMI_526]|nr:pyridoxal phosphate-dependent transferase [Flagelloscypha sp. PMI_526]
MRQVQTNIPRITKRLLHSTARVHVTPSIEISATKSGSPLRAFQKHITPPLANKLVPGIITSAKGSWVEFDDGRRSLDWTSGIGVTNLGHGHPAVTQAVVSQVEKVTHVQCGIAMHEQYLKLIEKLLPRMPHDSLDTFFFWNSGSEAVEAAVKIARATTGRTGVIAMQGGYHGRTAGASALTSSKTIYSISSAPLMPSIHFATFPYWHQLGLTDPSTCTETALGQVELLLKQRVAGHDTAAIIIEPVLGEGGYIAAPVDFLRGLREICDREGILLIIDEVQSGFGRTGDLWAVTESGVRPDILLSAKGLANGHPLSAVITSSSLSKLSSAVKARGRELSAMLPTGFLGGTYAGNAISCAAANAVLDLFSFLRSLQNDSDFSKHILDVRGRGLMVGLELASPTSPMGPYDSAIKKDAIPGLAKKITDKCIENGLMLMTTSAFEVIRFIPALTTTEEEMQIGLKVFKEAFTEIVNGHK